MSLSLTMYTSIKQLQLHKPSIIGCFKDVVLLNNTLLKSLNTLLLMNVWIDYSTENLYYIYIRLYISRNWRHKQEAVEKDHL